MGIIDTWDIAKMNESRRDRAILCVARELLDCGTPVAVVLDFIDLWDIMPKEQSPVGVQRCSDAASIIEQLLLLAYENGLCCEECEEAHNFLQGCNYGTTN